MQLLLTAAAVIIPLTLAAPVPVAASSSSQSQFQFTGSGTLLTVPTTYKGDLPSSPLTSASGCLAPSGKTLPSSSSSSSARTAAADGCGTFTAVPGTFLFRNAAGQVLDLGETSPPALGAGEGEEGAEGFKLWSDPRTPGYVYYGDFARTWYTGGSRMGDTVHLGRAAGDDGFVVLYFAQ